MKNLIYIISVIFIFSCTRKNENTVHEKPQKTENLVEISDGMYTEYYPGKTQIKFQGGQDENHQRHGKWTFFNTDGHEMSISFYEHGLKHGHSIVKYPSGAIYYYGEYEDDKQIGSWKTFDQKGNLISEKNYDIH